MTYEKLFELCSELAVKVYLLENKTTILESILFEFLINAGVISKEELVEKVQKYNEQKLSELKNFETELEENKIIT